MRTLALGLSGPGAYGDYYMTKTKEQRTVVIEAPRFEMADIQIVGTAPFVMNKFSKKAREEMRAKQELGSKSKKGQARTAKDFQATYEAAMHRSRDGWIGISAPAFRNAMISACRIVGFKMTLAKLSIFVEADGFDEDDGTPLVRIIGDGSQRRDCRECNVVLRHLFQRGGRPDRPDRPLLPDDLPAV